MSIIWITFCLLFVGSCQKVDYQSPEWIKEEKLEKKELNDGKRERLIFGKKPKKNEK